MLDESARAALAATRFGDLRWSAEVASTNDVAAALAREGAPEGVVVGADHQTAGRGRRGRRWEAPPGSSLLVSVLLRPPWPPSSWPVATLAVALATAGACAEVAGVDGRLKWPNDLLAGGRKVGGILAERAGDAVVVGLGLNVNWDRPPPDEGVALSALCGHDVDRAVLLVALLRRLDRLLADGPDRLVALATGRSATLGRPVRVDLGEAGTVEGTAVALTPEGHLMVETAAGGRQTVNAGDVVHLR
jgi:BirA family biotin operon repressor/biotin-[acetyl-CoA-carboxylase] ligase